MTNICREEYLAERKEKFLERFPAYRRTQILDELRRTEYARLDQGNHIYLDYTGGGLYAASQVQEHSRWLLNEVLGNPHSTNPTSLVATKAIEQTRKDVLQFFNASADEYVCVFTQNASGALKLIGEAYPFTSSSTYLLTFDNHNSVNGIREFARARGAKVVYSPVLPPELRLDEKALEQHIQQANKGDNHLFAYPAQSNFSGVQHDLSWVERAKAAGWDVLLDAAAFTPTNALDLSRVKPDFVCLSFYKIFGYPTGIGALIARHEAMEKLHRPWFAGGTITVASVQGDRYYLQKGAEGFEDGTLNYLMLPAVSIGLRHINTIGYEVIHQRLTALTQYLLEELLALQHSNGKKLVRLYGPADTRQRGATVTLNFYDRNGHFIDHRLVEARANECKISLRTGCFCNPGGGEVALGLTAEKLNSCFVDHSFMTIDDFRRCIDDKSSGAVRISMGLVSSFEDVEALLTFARRFLDHTVEEV